MGRTTSLRLLLSVLTVPNCSALSMPKRRLPTKHRTSFFPRPNNYNRDVLSVASSNHHPRSSALFVTGGGDVSTKTNEENEEDHDYSANGSSASTARILLLIVALLYGTLNVSLRLIYALPDPPEPSALSATRGWLATACFVPLLLSSKNNQRTVIYQTVDDVDNPSSGLSSDGKKSNAVTAATGFVWAATELAVWNFGAQGLLTLGLLSVASARAAFLTQLSVVLTPIVSLIAGQSITATVWAACLLALGGLTLLSGGITGITGGGLAAGDLFVLGGALCWSLYLFRLSKIGGQFPEVKLQAGKTAILGALYSIWWLISALSTGSNLWVGWQNPWAWAFLLYSALGPGTLADILQTQGQKAVSATEANILLSLEPVFTAVCAFFILGETTSMTENIGGGLILLAALLATL